MNGEKRGTRSVDNISIDYNLFVGMNREDHGTR